MTEIPDLKKYQIEVAKKSFLAALVELGHVGKACEATGIKRSRHYGWLQTDPDYAEAFKDATEMAIEMLEAEAIRRAVEGTEEPTGWYKGKAGGTVRKYSDVLLIFMLKGLAPEKYKDRMELKGAMANLDMSRLSDEQLARIAKGEHPLAVLSENAALPSGQDVTPDEEAEQSSDDDE